MIKFDHVSKDYHGQFSALSDITVDIPDGDFVFLIGPSGAGKSTMLRMILRDVLPSSGSVYVNDWNVGKLSPSHIYLLRRTVGMVFQDFKLLHDRTLYENVAIGLHILGKPETQIAKRVNNVLELVSLGDRKNFFPAQLSAGELQRVSIARAIVGGPGILLADEPTGNLDPETGWEILEILREIHKMGTTVIMATHNPYFVNELKIRTLTLQKGSMVSDETKGKYHLEPKHKSSEKKHKEGKE